MKKLYSFFLALVVLIFCQSVTGQQLLVQDFGFSGALTANGWTAHSSAGTNAVSTTTPGLSYTGYAGSGIGNAALVASVAGEDVNVTFTPQNTNGQSIYYAFLVNVNDAGTSKTGDYFFHTGSPGGGTWSTFAGRVFARIVSSNVNFGVSNTNTITWGSTNFVKSTTYLLVMKYTINTGGNDAVSLWVFPSGVPASEAAAGTAEVTNTSTAGTDAVNAIGLRQGSTSQPQTVVDGIRVGNTWTDAVQAAGAVNTVTAGAVSTPPFCVDATTSASGTVAYTASGTYNTTFTAYLSDASGSFAAPVAVGTATVNGANPAGNINVTILAGTASGAGYKIRIDAASPAVTGTASAAFEIANGARNVTGAGASTGNAQAAVSWTNPTSCFDEVLVVAKAAASVTATPAGNGSGYTASSVFGSGTPFDGGYVVYKGTGSSQTVTGLANGTLYYFKIFTRKGTAWSTGVEVSAIPSAQPGPGDILINQLSPDYNGADDEYIELINKTNNNVDLSGFAIRYQAANGNPGTAGGTLSGTLLARRYWLLSPNANVTVGQTTNLARDGAVMSGMGAAAGQLALIRLSDGVIIDAVGYGGAGAITGGTYTEGTAAPAPPADGGLKRSPDATDNNNNSADFVTVANAAILLRNSAAGSPLPVKFANLKAVQKGAAVHISWSNLAESDIKDYTVERSANSVDFAPFLKMAPTGNQQAQADYNATDVSPVKGLNYYRIRSTEASGKTTFSSVLKLSTAGAVPGLLVYPNPLKGAEGLLQLSNVPAGQYTVRMIGADGRVIQSRMIKLAEGSSTEPFSVAQLPGGIYTVQVTGGVNFQRSFIKQ